MKKEKKTMKTNILLWAQHYDEILKKYYEDFCLFLESYSEPIISYNEFMVFCYNNTKKNYIYLPGTFGKEIRAPLV